MSAPTEDRLLTSADLAAYFSVTVAKVMEWNRVYNWPRVKVGRSYRWTPEQVAEITRRHIVVDGELTDTQDGRTALSAKRSA